MKKKILLILFLTASILLRSQEVKTISPVFLKIFPVGDKDGEFGYIEASDYKGGSPPINVWGMGFDLDKNIYFSDVLNERYVIFNNDYDFIKNINYKYASGRQLKFISDDLLMMFYNSSSFSLFSIKKEKLLFFIGLSQKQFGSTNFFIYHEDTAFTYTIDGEIVCFQNPTIYWEKPNVMISTEETRKLFKPTYKGLKIDKEDRLFLNGKLLTRNYRHYITYWDEQHKNMSRPENTIVYEYRDSRFETMNVYLGEDKDGNTYWGYSQKFCVVFNKDGWPIDKFLWDDDSKMKEEISIFPPAIHPNGDIYLLYPSPKGAYLYMLPRTWGYDPKPGICTEDNVRVRVRPSLKAEIVCALKKDEKNRDTR